MPVRKIKGGIGIMLVGAMGFALLKAQSGGGPTEWLTGGMIWLYVAVYLIGSFTVMAGLGASHDGQLNNFAGLIGTICGIGASLAAALLSNENLVSDPLDWPGRFPLIAVAIAGFLIGWKALNARGT